MIDDFLEDGKWKCIQCGACCKMIDRVLPELDRGDGACIYLKDNMCSIYEMRPMLCRIPAAITDRARAMACNMVKEEIDG